MTRFTSAIERELEGSLVAHLNAEGVAFRHKGKRQGLSLRVAWADIEALSRGVAPPAPASASNAAKETEWHCPVCGFAANLGPGPWACPDCEKAGEATELLEGAPRLQSTLPGVVSPPAPVPAQAPLQGLPAREIAAPPAEGRKRRSKCPRCGDLGFFTKGHAHNREDNSVCKAI